MWLRSHAFAILMMGWNQSDSRSLLFHLLLPYYCFGSCFSPTSKWSHYAAHVNVISLLFNRLDCLFVVMCLPFVPNPDQNHTISRLPADSLSLHISSYALFSCPISHSFPVWLLVAMEICGCRRRHHCCMWVCLVEEWLTTGTHMHAKQDILLSVHSLQSQASGCFRSACVSELLQY